MHLVASPARDARTRATHFMLQSDRAMRIICPTCASHYEVEADKVGASGQLVRCAECREVWLVRPEAETVAERPAAPAAPGTPRTDREPSAFAAASQAGNGTIDFSAARMRLRQRRDSPAAAKARRTNGTTLLSVGLIGAMALGLAGGLRRAIVTEVPAMGPAYAMLGLTAGAEGLALQQVRSVVSADGDTRTLTLEGSIANLGNRSTPVPNLTVVVRDKAQMPLYTWTAAPPKHLLGRGETVAFKSRLTAPPAAGHDVRVSFAEVGAKVTPR